MYALDSNSLKELTRQFNAFLPNNFEGSYAFTNLQEIKFKNK